MTWGTLNDVLRGIGETVERVQLSESDLKVVDWGSRPSRVVAEGKIGFGWATSPYGPPVNAEDTSVTF